MSSSTRMTKAIVVLGRPAVKRRSLRRRGVVMALLVISECFEGLNM